MFWVTLYSKSFVTQNIAESFFFNILFTLYVNLNCINKNVISQCAEYHPISITFPFHDRFHFIFMQFCNTCRYWIYQITRELQSFCYLL